MISTGHIWLIGILLIVVLIIWGPGKLPDVGAGLGRAIKEFRHASTATRDEFNRATRPEDVATAAAAPVAAVPVAPVVTAVPTPVPAPAGGGPAPSPQPTVTTAGEGDHPTPG